jgi:hypothetical protein
MHPNPWPDIPVTPENFRQPPREYGILPFWFLNGELDPEEMRFQLGEFRAKGMPGIILHGRYGLEIPYIGPTYLERIRFAVEEAEKLGLKTWIYDEMNWPSGTADKRVLQARPDLAQRYIECINFTVRGPWFTYLTGADSRYLDFERSRPVAAFAVCLDGESGGSPAVIDLTPNLSFTNVIPWEAPAGNWRLIYIVEKEADYYIDALNPESTAEFLRLGYDPYAEKLDQTLSGQMLGFYTDEPAMHYYLTGGDNPVVPWTKDIFRRFQRRNGYNLRPRLPDLFFDITPDSARVRYDFFNTLTEFYSDAFYRQIHEWCQAHGVLFTGHLLYEEWLRRMIRVEGNLYKHYPHMDVIGVDHLYPIIGSQDRPDEHVAMKAGSSGAHLLGSPRLLCESFGGIFMDATMQRMKWIADWEYVLGVNLLNPHGFHYTLEGPRKRDWPPSQFYQYPWWQYYGEFSNYMSRLSHLLSGGRHVAKAAVLWPINAMFATYTPQSHNLLGDRTEADFNVLTDTLLRVHYDFDYMDEDVLASAEISGGSLRVRDESFELVILPPMAHMKLSTLEKLEAFLAEGGKVLGMIFLPDQAFSQASAPSAGSRLVDISERMRALFEVDPGQSQREFRNCLELEVLEKDHPGGGKAAFLRSYALARQLPMRLQKSLGIPGCPENPHFVIESGNEASRYFYAPQAGERVDITTEVMEERSQVAGVLQNALNGLVDPDVIIDNRNVLYLHRVKDGQDLYFFTNPTYTHQTAVVTLTGEGRPVRWDPSTGDNRPVAPWKSGGNRVHFTLVLPSVGSAFILVQPSGSYSVAGTNITIDQVGEAEVGGFGQVEEAFVLVERAGKQSRLKQKASGLADPLILDGEWAFHAEHPNALVIGQWLTGAETPGQGPEAYARPEINESAWLPMVPGAWSYQLPAEPEANYPIPVWYRISFHVDTLAPWVGLIVDGFAGSEWRLYANGQPVTAAPARSAIDSQMKEVDITPHLRPGRNVLALRLVLTSATDGLLDPLKITGDFRLEKAGDGAFRIAPPRRRLDPAPWTVQGYPYYSGIGVYRRRFSLPDHFTSQRVFVEAEMGDDVLEVIVNGQPAGVRLWAPYGVEVTELLNPGENELELRVANTLVNLLEAVERPSGLAGAPRLVAYPRFVFELKHEA